MTDRTRRFTDEATLYARNRAASVADIFTGPQLELLEVMLAAAHIAGASYATKLANDAFQEVRIPLHPFKPIEEVTKS